MQTDNVFLGSKSYLMFQANLTPAALAASIGMKEEAFTVNPPQPLRTTDLVFVTPPPGAVEAESSVVGARVTSATQITLIFANLSAAANVPTAGNYGFLVLRV